MAEPLDLEIRIVSFSEDKKKRRSQVVTWMDRTRVPCVSVTFN